MDSTKKRRTVLIGMDSSIYSKNALSWTLDNLIRNNDHIILISVGVFHGTWGDFLSAAFSGPIQNEERVKALKAQAEDFALQSLSEASEIIEKHVKDLHESFEVFFVSVRINILTRLPQQLDNTRNSGIYWRFYRATRGIGHGMPTAFS